MRAENLEDTFRNAEVPDNVQCGEVLHERSMGELYWLSIDRSANIAEDPAVPRQCSTKDLAKDLAPSSVENLLGHRYCTVSSISCGSLIPLTKRLS